MQLSQVCQHRGGKKGPDIHEQSHGLLTFCRISTAFLVQLTITRSLFKLLITFGKLAVAALKTAYCRVRTFTLFFLRN